VLKQDSSARLPSGLITGDLTLREILDILGDVICMGPVFGASFLKGFQPAAAVKQRIPIVAEGKI
jgi:hypothetical protein